MMGETIPNRLNMNQLKEAGMNNIIWWVGFIVILLAILSFLGLR
ncbi:hypothetical protein SAMN05216412_101629 [Nitrosospira multiformis]|uniref:Uncharacterized protein n=1 Tax=Nitrosospira multiformis TaxID=1231 RepID=A0A1H9ZEX6_9PROT|nr:hypothetical protein SAMN05216412_101629 [Nitrosospira multiformis]